MYFRIKDYLAENGVARGRLYNVLLYVGVTMKNEHVKIIVFALYSVLFEAIIWGIFGYAVFILRHSGWWMVLAALTSGMQLKPKHFGIKLADV